MVDNCTETVTSFQCDLIQPESLPLGLRIVLGIVIIVTMAISICGNFVVCYLVYRKPSMRSAINLLLAHIGLSDMFLSILVMPFSFVTLITNTWELTDIFCRIIGFLQNYFVSVGVIVLLAITADRYFIISKRKEKLNLFRSHGTLVFIWCFSAVLSLPPTFGWTKYKFQSGLTVCLLSASRNLSDLSYMFLFTIVTFLLPVLLMFCAFTCIVDIVRKNGMKVQQQPLSALSPSSSIPPDSPSYDNFQNLDSCESSRRSSIIINSRAPSISIFNLKRNCFPETKNRVTLDMSFKTRAYKTILILSIVLVLCWAPFVATYFTTTFHNNPSPVVISVLLCLGYIKSAANPIIYAVRIKKFRDACISMLPEKVANYRHYGNTKRRHDHQYIYTVEARSSI